MWGMLFRRTVDVELNNDIYKKKSKEGEEISEKSEQILKKIKKS